MTYLSMVSNLFKKFFEATRRRMTESIKSSNVEETQREFKSEI